MLRGLQRHQYLYKLSDAAHREELSSAGHLNNQIGAALSFEQREHKPTRAAAGLRWMMSVNKTISAIEDAGFGAFARLLASDGAADASDSGTPFTIFAPTDIAFGKLARPFAYRLMKDGVLRRAVGGFHIAAGKVMSKRFVGARIRAVTHQGQILVIDGRDGVQVNGANFVCPDIAIGANVLHGIDAVLWPELAVVTS